MDEPDDMLGAAIARVQYTVDLQIDLASNINPKLQH